MGLLLEAETFTSPDGYVEPIAAMTDELDSSVLDAYQIEITEVVPALGLEDQHACALRALDALEKLERARIIKETAAQLPGIVPPSETEEAFYQSVDQGAIWRRETDTLSTTIAQLFPNQCLTDDVFNNEEVLFLSDGQKLYRVDDELNVWAFSSVITQAEMNSDVRVATEQMWQELLLAVLVAKP